MSAERSIPLPNFIVGGAAKCATTSLAHYLDEHPDVCVSRPKECHFFDSDDDYARGPDHYRRYFKHWAGESAVGDATPAYLHGAHIAERIRETLPGVKLIFIFRDPVRRAYSNYWHAIRAGRTASPFEQAINEPRCRHLLERSRYARYLEAYLDVFDRERMLFLLTERLAKAPQEVMREVFRFIGVDDSFDCSRTSTQKNTNTIPRSLRLARFQRRHFSVFVDHAESYHYDAEGRLEIRQARRSFLPVRRLGAKLISMVNNRRAEYPPMDETLSEELARDFDEDNRRFAALTGLPIEEWWPSARRASAAPEADQRG